MSENGATSNYLSVCQMGTQFQPATVVLAWLSIFVLPYNAFSARPPNDVPARDPLTLSPPPDFGLLSSNGLVFISKIIRRLADFSSDIWAQSSDVLFIINHFIVLPPPPCLRLAHIASWCGTTSFLIHFFMGRIRCVAYHLPYELRMQGNLLWTCYHHVYQSCWVQTLQ